jgi:hypothetical protein
MIMKKIIIVFFLMLPALYLGATGDIFADLSQDSLTVDSASFILDDMPHAVFYQDSTITDLLKVKSRGYHTGQYQKSGFRVQVYSSNDSRVAKNEAITLEERLAKEVDVTIYLISEPPFWKVRLGDFLTRDETLKYMQLINQQFPDLRGDTYVVKDVVTINN